MIQFIKYAGRDDKCCKDLYIPIGIGIIVLFVSFIWMITINSITHKLTQPINLTISNNCEYNVHYNTLYSTGIISINETKYFNNDDLLFNIYNHFKMYFDATYYDKLSPNIQIINNDDYYSYRVSIPYCNNIIPISLRAGNCTSIVWDLNLLKIHPANQKILRSACPNCFFEREYDVFGYKFHKCESNVRDIYLILC
jgi:hypothetical protein